MAQHLTLRVRARFRLVTALHKQGVRHSPQENHRLVAPFKPADQADKLSHEQLIGEGDGLLVSVVTKQVRGQF